MKTITLFSLFVLHIFSCSSSKITGAESAQEQKIEKRNFADSEAAIRKFREDSQTYWDRQDSENALKYQDSIKSAVIGTYLQDYEFVTVDSSLFNTAGKPKPMFLQVTASWCAPCKAEIPSLNRIAERYKNEVDFVLLFWDSKEELLKLLSQYSKAIALVPSTEKQQDSEIISISGFRHIMGFPTNYLIASDKQVINFSQGAIVPTTYTNSEGKKVTITKEEADNRNYERLEKEILELIEEQKLPKAKAH